MQLDEYLKLTRELVEQQYGKAEVPDKEVSKPIDCGDMSDEELRQCLLTRPRRLQIGKFEIKLEWQADKVHAEIYEIKNKVHCRIQVERDIRMKDQPWVKQWSHNSLDVVIAALGHLQCLVFLPLFL
jgi:hypothetical protein